MVAVNLSDRRDPPMQNEWAHNAISEKVGGTRLSEFEYSGDSTGNIKSDTLTSSSKHDSGLFTPKKQDTLQVKQARSSDMGLLNTAITNKQEGESCHQIGLRARPSSFLSAIPESQL